MYYLKSITIKNMWGNRTIKTNFNKDVNIFIGYNGTGKTTFLNIITGILSVDLSKLLHNKFSEARMILISDDTKTQKQKTILVTIDSNEVVYKISREIFHIPINTKFPDIGVQYYPRKLMIAQREAVNKIVAIIRDFCTINDISVHRELHRINRGNDWEHDDEKFIPLVDKKLDEVSQDLFAFKRQLDSDVNDVFIKFQKNMLTTMLYDEKFDTLERMSKIKYSLEKLQDGLLRAYKNVGLSSEEITLKIKEHIAKIGHSLKVKEELDKSSGGKAWAANDAFPLTAYFRTIYIVKQLDNAEDEKGKILFLWNLFLETFKSFCGKEIVFSAVDKVIHLHYGDNVLNLENLSSGEKQLFILLAEVLLKNRQHVVSITDEPELSLHISWQQKILPALHKLNPACQIIIATHSPEIAGSYPDKIILMEDILS